MLVLLREIVEVTDDVQLVVLAKLLSSECSVWQLYSMEGSVLAVEEANESRKPLTSKGENHLIRNWLASHV